MILHDMNNKTGQYGLYPTISSNKIKIYKENIKPAINYYITLVVSVISVISIMLYKILPAIFARA